LRPGQAHRLATALLRPIASVFELAELVCTCKAEDSAWTDSYPIVFIVGAPRSGTTIVYQCLSHALDVYFPNHLCSLFPRSPLLALLASSVLQRKPHRSFRSIHGFSLSSGLRGPNEWETFFRYDVHARLRSGWNPHPRLERLVRGLARWGTKPLIVKTLNASLLIEPLAACLPHAKFLWVDRPPLASARSIYRAKRAEKTPSSEVWYVSPSAVRGKRFENEASQIAAQVRAIREAILAAFLTLPSQRKEATNYCTFCGDPHGETVRIGKWIHSDFRIRAGSQLPSLRASSSAPIDDPAIEEALFSELNKPSPIFSSTEPPSRASG